MSALFQSVVLLVGAIVSVFYCSLEPSTVNKSLQVYDSTVFILYSKVGIVMVIFRLFLVVYWSTQRLNQTHQWCRCTYNKTDSKL